MLYYLDILPVPDHLRAYLQNAESSTLSHGVNAPAEKCAPVTLKKGKDEIFNGGDISNAKERPSSALECANLRESPSDITSNNQFKENGILKKRSLIPKLVRSKSSPQGFESCASESNEIVGNFSSAGSRIPSLKRNRRNNFGFATTRPSRTLSASNNSFDDNRDLYLHKRSLSSCSALKRNGKPANIGFNGSLSSKTNSTASINTDVDGKELYLNTRSLSNCSSKLPNRCKLQTDDGPRCLASERGRHSRRSGFPVNAERQRSVSLSRSKRFEGTESSSSSVKKSSETYYPRDDVIVNKVRSDSFVSLSKQNDYDSYNSINSIKDYNEVLRRLLHESPGAKRDGLISLQTYLASGKSLTTAEARKTRDIFNRYFAEANSKIYSVFLDALSEFIVQYRHELQDWLFILLTRLLHRISSEVLPSSQTKIAMVLDVVRSSYPYDHQFQILTKYITDNTASPTIKMKARMLQYLTGLIPLMDASDFSNTVLIRLAVSRIVTWISEPKSPEVRKEAAGVIIALFQLNSAEFSMLLSSVPNSIQDGATRVIQARLKTRETENAMAQLSLSNERRNQYAPNNMPVQTPLLRKVNSSDEYNYRKPPAEDYHVEPPVRNYNREQRTNFVGGNDFSPPTFPNGHSREDVVDGVESTNATSRFTYTHTSNKYMYTSTKIPPNDVYGLPRVSSKPPLSSSHTAESRQWLSKDSTPTYTPRRSEDSVFTENFPTTTPVNRIGDGAEHPDDDGACVETNNKQPLNLFNQISTILCNQKDSNDSADVKGALHELNKLVRSWDKQVVTPMLKDLLPDVLGLLKHNEATIRCLAARSLREVATSHPETYRGNLNSFVVPLLQTEADKQKEVAKTAEECCSIISQTLSADDVIPVISPLVGGTAYPVNLSAIKMLNVICEKNCDKTILMKHIDVVMNNLLKAFDHNESSARKAAVFCLVSVHNLAGIDAVTPYFNDLEGSKFKLLSLYIRRSLSTNL